MYVLLRQPAVSKSHGVHPRHDAGFWTSALPLKGSKLRQPIRRSEGLPESQVQRLDEPLRTISGCLSNPTQHYRDALLVR